jgi:hypothetical protein
VTTHQSDGATDTANNRGFGDTSFYLTTRLWSDFEHHPTTWLELRGMVKAPTGSSDKKIDGGADPHIQMGTGSWDFGLGLAAGHHFEHFAVHANVYYRLNTLGSLHYQYGDVFLGNLIATSEALPVTALGGALLRPGVELNYRYSGHDQFEDDFYRSSGGSILNVTPFLGPLRTARGRARATGCGSRGAAAAHHATGCSATSTKHHVSGRDRGFRSRRDSLHFATSKPNSLAAFRPSTLARCPSERPPMVRSIAAAECGQLPSWCG